MSEPAAPPRPTVVPHDGPAAALRLRRANREQVVPIPAYLDALLPEDHLARLLWQAVDRLDRSAFCADLRGVQGGPGRAAADPAVLITLWLYATAQGVTRARALERGSLRFCGVESRILKPQAVAARLAGRFLTHPTALGGLQMHSYPTKPQSCHAPAGHHSSSNSTAGVCPRSGARGAILE